MPWLGRSIFELAITARCVFPYSRRSHLPVRMPCGFLEVSYGTACPVLVCPSRRVSSVLPLHGTPLVMSSFQSPRSSSRPTGSHRPSPRLSTRRAGRGCLLGLRGLSCPHAVVCFLVIASHPDAHRLACLPRRPMPINPVGRLRLSSLTAGVA